MLFGWTGPCKIPNYPIQIQSTEVPNATTEKENHIPRSTCFFHRKSQLHGPGPVSYTHLEAKLASETLDVSIPGVKTELGHRHPVNQVIDMVTEIFLGMGFTRAEGPEVELADYNFTRLNTDEGHPAREWSDTFYLREDSSLLLRTQTSPMQIRVMESHKPPIRIVAPGRVYRKDEADATHSPMFHQIEGMVVDKGVTMADLKGTLNEVVKSLYGEDAVTRFRPHHFPFTEPSCEVDVQCFSCKGKGCSVCKGCLLYTSTTVLSSFFSF